LTVSRLQFPFRAFTDGTCVGFRVSVRAEPFGGTFGTIELDARCSFDRFLSSFTYLIILLHNIPMEPIAKRPVGRPRKTETQPAPAAKKPGGLRRAANKAKEGASA